MGRGGFIFALVFLFFGLSSASAIILHSASSVFVNVTGTGAINLNADSTNFIATHTYSSVSNITTGHDASQIWVSVKDGEMTLLQALQSTDKLCPATPIRANYTSSPSNKSRPYHYANEVQLSSGKNLQQSINDGDFCPSYTYHWVLGAWSGCSSCGGTSERTVNCQRNDGVYVLDSYCPSPKPDTWYSCACHWQETNYYGGEYVGPCVCNDIGGRDIGLCGYVVGTGCSAYNQYTICTCGVTCGPSREKTTYIQCLPGG